MKKFWTLALVAGAACVNADVIVSYNSTGMAGNEAFMAGNAGVPEITALDLVRGAGLAPVSGGNSLNSQGWNQEPTDYLSFGFIVNPGFVVNLDRMIIGTRSSNTGPGTLGLYYNGDGFVNPLFIFNQAGAGFVNIDTPLILNGLTGNVEFRVIQIGTTSANGGTTAGTGTFRIGDYTNDGGLNFIDTQFQGTVTPAPASLALLACGGLAAARRRRA